jgi:hypothetical protein
MPIIEQHLANEQANWARMCSDAPNTSTSPPHRRTRPANHSRDRGREGETHKENEQHIPSLLPTHDRALSEIAHVRHARSPLDEHPADVALPETAVEIVINVAVMSAVATSSPSDRSLP